MASSPMPGPTEHTWRLNPRVDPDSVRHLLLISHTRFKITYSSILPRAGGPDHASGSGQHVVVGVGIEENASLHRSRRARHRSNGDCTVVLNLFGPPGYV